MNWMRLLAEGRVRRHRTSPEEIAGLRKVAARNLGDAASEAISADTRFACAFEAAIALITMAMAASGYRAKGPGHHRTTIEALPLAMTDAESRLDAIEFDRCRRLRNELSYETAGVVDRKDAAELLARVLRLHESVAAWIREHYPRLV